MDFFEECESDCRRSRRRGCEFNGNWSWKWNFAEDLISRLYAGWPNPEPHSGRTEFRPYYRQMAKALTIKRNLSHAIITAHHINTIRLSRIQPPPFDNRKGMKSTTPSSPIFIIIIIIIIGELFCEQILTPLK